MSILMTIGVVGAALIIVLIVSGRKPAKTAHSLRSPASQSPPGNNSPDIQATAIPNDAQRQDTDFSAVTRPDDAAAVSQVVDAGTPALSPWQTELAQFGERLRDIANSATLLTEADWSNSFLEKAEWHDAEGHPLLAVDLNGFGKTLQADLNRTFAGANIRWRGEIDNWYASKTNNTVEALLLVPPKPDGLREGFSVGEIICYFQDAPPSGLRIGDLVEIDGVLTRQTKSYFMGRFTVDGGLPPVYATYGMGEAAGDVNLTAEVSVASIKTLKRGVGLTITEDQPQTKVNDTDGTANEATTPNETESQPPDATESDPSTETVRTDIDISPSDDARAPKEFLGEFHIGVMSFVSGSFRGTPIFVDRMRPSFIKAADDLVSDKLLSDICKNADELRPLPGSARQLLGQVNPTGKKDGLHIAVFTLESIPVTNQIKSPAHFVPGAITTFADVNKKYGTPNERENWSLKEYQEWVGLNGTVSWWGSVGVASPDDGKITHVLVREKESLAK
jgi:hypothetical protein